MAISWISAMVSTRYKCIFAPGGPNAIHG